MPFHLEAELLQPTLTALRLNEAVLKLFLVPDEDIAEIENGSRDFRF